MSDKTTLGNRMKLFYENPFRYYLPRRTPMVIRLDIRAGHSFTRGFKRPFDDIFIKSIQETAKYLCENIENVKLSYQQSDEISLLLTDYDNLNTEAWFARNIQKMSSVSASMATLAFNRAFEELVLKYFSWNDYNNYEEALHKALNKGAMFDARCFSIPKEEVCNYFQWRQMDCTRNSINMVAQTNFSHKELQGKSCNDMQNMLLTQKNINWNNFSTPEKRGSCCIKDGISQHVDIKTNQISTKKVWRIDYDIPIFSENREYIESLI